MVLQENVPGEFPYTREFILSNAKVKILQECLPVKVVLKEPIEVSIM
jgi:hypothetical protein